MPASKITRAQMIARRLLTDTAVLWRCTATDVSETGERVRTWEHMGDIDCLVQNQAPIEGSQQTNADRHNATSMVFKTAVGEDTMAGDMIELATGQLLGNKYILGAPQEQSLAILRLHYAEPYSGHMGDTYAR